MGSSCSSRQSDKDSASVHSDDSQDDLGNTGSTVQSPSERLHVEEEEKERIRQKSTLRHLESDFSSGGDDGTGAGTPVSTSMSGCAANGSTKGKPPEKKDVKAPEELPNLSLLKEETRSLLKGNIYHEKTTRKNGCKICVFILGCLDDTGERTKEVINNIKQEITKQMDEKGIEIVVLNPHLVIPLPRVPLSPSDLLSSYLKGQREFSSILVLMLRGTNIEMMELPPVLSETDFSKVVDPLVDDELKLLHRWYIQDIHNSAYRRLKSPPFVFHGLISNNSEEFHKAYNSWCSEYKQTLAVLRKSGYLRLKSTAEKDLEWVKDMPQEGIFKVIHIRKDAKKTPVDNKMDLFLESFGTDENVRRSAKQIFQENRSEFDILQPKLSSDEGSDLWWKEIATVIKSTITDCLRVFPLSPEIQKVNPVEDGVKVKLLEEIVYHHSCTLENIQRKYRNVDVYLNQIQKYLASPLSKPLLVCGSHGVGKTSLISLASASAMHWNPDACIITRYVGLTNNCTTVEGLLYFLVEHILTTHGHCSSYTCIDMTYTLETLLKKASRSRPIIILIDGVDQIASNPLDLFGQLPDHVKVIMSAQEQSSLHQEFSIRVQNEECLLKIEDLSKSDSKILLEDFMLNNKQKLPDSMWERIQTNNDAPMTPLYLMILSHIFFLGTTHEDDFGFSLEDGLRFLVNKLKTLYPKKVIEGVLGCLSLSRTGLLDHEIISIIRSEEPYKSENSVLDWLCLRNILSPLIRIRKEKGLMLVSFSSNYIREFFVKCLLEAENLMSSCQQLLRKHVVRCDESRILKISLPEDGKRSLSYVRGIHNSLLLVERKQEELFFNISWLFKIVETSGPFKILDDIDLALKNAQNRELSILREVVHLSSSSLMYDSSQFFSQIYGRLKRRLHEEEKCVRLSTLLANASKSPLPCLLPISASLTGFRPDKPSQKDTQERIYIDSIFRIPRNPHHVIAISTERSQVTVWNIFTMERVRTLTGINQPRNLEMIDDYKCLLLCGRELRIYNLNEGTFLMKLREVMNQKSPFFGLHDSDHVVALSRSRMYVNMMNLSEGNCVTTFKVGEDRFLNSLLVSENGNICVCGDDSQKPSALLVWDLQLRKLMYDLRIPHHEFATRLAAITTEGHYVCCVCKELDEPAPNFIVVYDLQSGTLFKRWKPEVNTISIAISTAGTCVIVGLEDSSIMAYDLITGNRRWTVYGHTYPPDRFRLDQKGLVLLSFDSQGRDQSVRVWEVPTGKCLATLTPDHKISTGEITCDGKAVVLSLEGHDAIFTFLLLHKEDPQKVMERHLPYGDEECKGKIVDFSQT